LVGIALLGGADVGELVAAAVVRETFARGLRIATGDEGPGRCPQREIQAARHALSFEFVAARDFALARIAGAEIPGMCAQRPAGVERNFAYVVAATHGV